ncbi:MAG: DUF2147 domain-containing protein [Edaphocola sp.]
MKRTALMRVLLPVAIGLLATCTAFAQSARILGYWFNEEKDAKVQIFKATNGKYYGKIVWLQEPDRDGKPKTDINNPKETERNSPLLGLLILKGFNKDSDKLYEDGTIYDPKNGKTYSCKITQESDNQLSIRGFIGISLIGRTTTWTRTTN